jgi:hypothetical protein
MCFKEIREGHLAVTDVALVIPLVFRHLCAPKWPEPTNFAHLPFFCFSHRRRLLTIFCLINQIADFFM